MVVVLNIIHIILILLSITMVSITMVSITISHTHHNESHIIAYNIF